jgi:hypothetical protein
MRRTLTPLLAALLAAAATAGLAIADRDDDARGGGPRGGQPHALGVWGDVPYSDVQTASGVPNLIADMNGQRLAFSVHNGDIKAGGSRCDDPVYARFEAFLNSLEAPAMYTPGDNEWTDCDRDAAGAYDSEERLGHLRSTLFDGSRSFGQRRIRLSVQEAPYVENRRWRVDRVVYATLHVVGSDNNLGDVAPDPEEWAARDTATNEWLRETFDRAERARAAGLLLVIQANPGFDLSDPTRAPLRDPRTLLASPSGQPDGFTNFLRILREETIAFRRPVVLVHGDSHYFRIDKPLQDEQGRRLENFTRLETPGDNAQNGNNDVHWVKVIADPRSREVFSFQPQVVPANRVAVPAP